MLYTNLSESCTEILDILQNIDKSLYNKVPKRFVSFLEENKSKTYIPNIDYSKEVKDWDIGQKTKNILGILYLNYWSTPSQKKEYIKILKKNEKIYQEEINKKYNANNLFKNKKDKKN